MIDEYLTDVKCKNITTKDNNSVFVLGNEIFEHLKNLKEKNNKLIKGMYYTHYTSPPADYSHVRIGIRYIDSTLAIPIIQEFFNNLLLKYANLITLSDLSFESPMRYTNNIDYPKGVIIDYLLCDYFDFLIKFKNEVESFVSWFLSNRKDFNEIINKYENEVGRQFNDEELFKFLERLTHHLMNSYPLSLDDTHKITGVLQEREFFARI